MSRFNRYQYYVEGETEKKLVDALKIRGLICPGNVNVFNVKLKKFTDAMLISIPTNTIVILLFDTDTDNTPILEGNLKSLKKCGNVKDIWCVTQVENLEDELLRATNVREIRELTGSRSNSDFKRDWLREKHVVEKLERHGFNPNLLWVTPPGKGYDGFENSGYKVKT